MSDRPDITIRELQQQNREWVRRNFHPDDIDDPERAYRPLLGATEELGEFASELLDYTLGLAKVIESVGRISHHELKMRQGIRGSYDEHVAAMKDAIGDHFIFLVDFCTAHGFDLQDIVQTTWEEVSKRDWTANSSDGKPTRIEVPVVTIEAAELIADVPSFEVPATPTSAFAMGAEVMIRSNQRRGVVVDMEIVTDHIHPPAFRYVVELEDSRRVVVTEANLTNPI